MTKQLFMNYLQYIDIIICQIFSSCPPTKVLWIVFLSADKTLSCGTGCVQFQQCGTGHTFCKCLPLQSACISALVWPQLRVWRQERWLVVWCPELLPERQLVWCPELLPERQLVWCPELLPERQLVWCPELLPERQLVRN